jgi:agmatinase
MAESHRTYFIDSSRFMTAREFKEMGRAGPSRAPEADRARESQAAPARSRAVHPVVLFGAPFDGTMSFRTGARHGPGAIREYSYVLETFSTTAGGDLETIALFDAGDVDLAPGETGPALDRIQSAVAEILSRGGRPLMLGGEHLVTLPSVRAVHAVYPGLQVIHVDAHADMRLHYLGQELTHAGVMRRVCEVVGRENVYSAGIRSVSADEHEYATSPAANFSASLDALKDFAGRAGNRPVYLTIDIDVADPAFAPGTGAPEPGGPSSRELLNAIAGLQGLDLVAADIVEVAPPYDPAGITAALAAKVAREVIMMMALARGRWAGAGYDHGAGS